LNRSDITSNTAVSVVVERHDLISEKLLKLKL